MIHQKVRQYRVLERLGTGGMGSVFRASDDMLGHLRLEMGQRLDLIRTERLTIPRLVSSARP